MSSVYDWLTTAMFAGLVTLFLQRSSAEEPSDKLYQYFPPTIGCAIANYLGNHGMALPAIGIIAAIVVYVWYVLKPLARGNK
ncbi:hypothetical protein BH11PSE5_BH11PSE5_10810 [soil metagenome]